MTKKNRNEKVAGRVGGAADGATAAAPKGRNRTAKAAQPVAKAEPSGEILPVAQNLVASADAVAVSSETDVTTTPDSGTAVEPVAAGETKMTQLTLVRTKPNGSATYAILGVPGTIRIAKAVFGGNTPPATLEVQGDGLATMNPEKAAKYAKKAENKAKLSETREQRLEKLKNRSMLQEKRAANAKARLEKAQKREADRLAKLAAKSGAPVEATPTTDTPAAEMAQEPVGANA